MSQRWNGDWFPLPGQAVFDRDKQHIAAVSRAEGNLDLFVIGFDNRIWSTFWTAAGGWNHDWFPLPGHAVFDRDKQQVAAVSRAEGNLDLFVIGFDNHIWSTFWTEAGSWNHDWFPLPGQAVFDRDKQQVAAVSRAEGNLDLFVIGFDNHIWSTYGGPPPRLQFRLRGFSEHDSTDRAAQGASDEVYISAIGTDSAAVHFGPDEKLAVDLIEAPMIGDVSRDDVRGPWGRNPHVLLEFDLNRTGFWPRTYVVTLLIVEHDNQDLADTFNEIKDKVGNEVRAAVIAAATSGGAAIGTAVLPGIGTAVGAAAGFLAGFAWDVVIPAIGEGLENEAFKPRVLTLMIPEPWPNRSSREIDRPQSIRVEERGAVYDIHYDWHIAEG